MLLVELDQVIESLDLAIVHSGEVFFQEMFEFMVYDAVSIVILLSAGICLLTKRLRDVRLSKLR
jgi:uncharacterized membrane protein YhaH (DUF805 family)